MASALRRKSVTPAPSYRRRSDSSISQRRESLSDRTVSQEKALEISFWDGIFGVVGIRNHTEIDYTDPEIFNHELKSSEQLLKRMTQIHIINPSGIRKLYWDVIVGIAILFSIITVPFTIGFTGDADPSLGIDGLNAIIDIIFFVDICTTFRTAYFDPYSNALITDGYKIRNQYLRFWFWCDMASTIPFNEIIQAAQPDNTSGSGLKAMKLLRILRLSRLAKLHRLLKSQNFKDFVERSHISPSLISVIVLMLQIFLVAHIVSCFWFFITTDFVTLGKEGYANGELLTWAGQNNFDRADITSQYIISLFWTVQTLLTVGYGDVTPTNTIERAYALVVMLLGGLMFGSIIAKVQEVVESRNLTAKEIKIMMKEFTLSLDQNKIPLVLKTEAKDAYSYYLNNRPSIAEHGFYDQLPVQLRLKLINERFYKEIQAIHVFRNSDNTFISRLITHSKPQLFLEGDIIYGAGDMSDEISFIVTGSVRITVPGIKDVLLGCGTVGGFFGDFEYHKNSKRSAQYEVVRDCSILGISYKDLSAAIDDHPEAGAKFLAQLKRRYEMFLMVRNASYSKRIAGTTKRISPKNNGNELTEKNNEKNLKNLNNMNNLNNKLNQESRSNFSVLKIFNPLNSIKLLMNYIKEVNKSEPNSFRANFAKMTSNTHNDYDYVTGEYLWTDGEIAPAKTMENIKLNMFAVTATDVSYRMMMIDKNGKEILFDMAVKKLLQLRYIHPRDPIKNKWDYFMAIIIIYSVMTIPLQLGFSSYVSLGLTVTDYIIDILFFIDILINFNLVYYSDIEGVYIAVRSSISRKYLQSWFIIDFLSCFPFSDIVMLAVQMSNKAGAAGTSLSTIQLVKSVRLIRLMKLFQAIDVTKILDRMENNFNIKPAALSLIVTIIQVLFISHMVACLWWGLTTKLSSYTWYDDLSSVYIPLRNAPFIDQYVASLYWTVTTLTTVGYGDIVPINDEERILAIFIMVIGATVFGYTIANVAAIVTDGSYIDGQAHEKLIIIKEFLKECKCNNQLNVEIINHFKEAYKAHSTADLPIMYNKLPNHIRIKLFTMAHREVMSHIALFNYIKNPSVKYYLFTLMTMNVGATGRCLIKEGKTGSEIFFLVEGKANIFRTIITPHSTRNDSKNNSKDSEDSKDGFGNNGKIGASQFLARIVRRKSTDNRTLPNGKMVMGGMGGMTSGMMSPSLGGGTGVLGGNLGSDNDDIRKKLSYRLNAMMNISSSRNARNSSVRVVTSITDRGSGLSKNINDNTDILSHLKNRSMKNSIHKTENKDNNDSYNDRSQAQLNFCDDNIRNNKNAINDNSTINNHSCDINDNSTINDNSCNISYDINDESENLISRNLTNPETEYTDLYNEDCKSNSYDHGPIVNIKKDNEQDNNENINTNCEINVPNHTYSFNDNIGHNMDNDINNNNYDNNINVYDLSHSINKTPTPHTPPNTTPRNTIPPNNTPNTVPSPNTIPSPTSIPSPRNIPKNTKSDIPKPKRNVPYRIRLRSQNNWNEVKNAIPQIADMEKKKRSEELLEHSRSIPLGELMTGEFIGHREMMRGEKHGYTVTATTPCKYYTLHAKTISKLIQEHPDIALELQAAVGHAVFHDDQATAEKRARKKKQDFLQEINEKSNYKRNKIQKSKSNDARNKFIAASVLKLFSGSTEYIFEKKEKTPMKPPFTRRRSSLDSNATLDARISMRQKDRVRVRDTVREILRSSTKSNGSANGNSSKNGNNGNNGGNNVNNGNNEGNGTTLGSERNSGQVSPKGSIKGHGGSGGNGGSGGSTLRWNALRGAVRQGSIRAMGESDKDDGSVGGRGALGAVGGMGGVSPAGGMKRSILGSILSSIHGSANSGDSSKASSRGSFRNSQMLSNSNRAGSMRGSFRGSTKGNNNNQSKGMHDSMKRAIIDKDKEFTEKPKRNSLLLMTIATTNIIKIAPIDTKKRHRSHSDLLDIPTGSIQPELFLLEKKHSKEEKSFTKVQRRQSFPTDKSQYDRNNVRGHLDAVDFFEAKKVKKYGRKEYEKNKQGSSRKL